MKEYIYPKSMKKLRACTKCHLLKTEEQFIQDGCENCRENLDKKEMLQSITPNFKGMIAITTPEHSWCARWLHKTKLLPGFYSVDIVSEDIDENDEYEEE